MVKCFRVPISLRQLYLIYNLKRINVARFARNVAKWDFLCDFQTVQWYKNGCCCTHRLLSGGVSYPFWFVVGETKPWNWLRTFFEGLHWYYCCCSYMQCDYENDHHDPKVKFFEFLGVAPYFTWEQQVEEIFKCHFLLPPSSKDAPRTFSSHSSKEFWPYLWKLKNLMLDFTRICLVFERLPLRARFLRNTSYFRYFRLLDWCCSFLHILYQRCQMRDKMSDGIRKKNQKGFDEFEGSVWYWWTVFWENELFF